MIDLWVRAHTCRIVSGSNSDQSAFLEDMSLYRKGPCKWLFSTSGDFTHANVPIYSEPWRMAGWMGNVVFDGTVTGLTLFRAVKLRKSGFRVTLVELMLKDGIHYFGNYLLKQCAIVC
jgi:hypothetical protein